MKEIRKITNRMLGSKDKMVIFKWITKWITLNGENEVWGVGGPRVVSQKIKKTSLNFEGKAWWTLARHRLCQTTGDDILSPVWAAMIVSFIIGYKFDVVELLSQDIRDHVVGGKKALLAYPSMITQICLVVGVLELPGIDEMIEDRRTTYLGLIRDAANQLGQQVRQAVDILAGLFPWDG